MNSPDIATDVQRRLNLRAAYDDAALTLAQRVADGTHSRFDAHVLNSTHDALEVWECWRSTTGEHTFEPPILDPLNGWELRDQAARAAFAVEFERLRAKADELAAHTPEGLLSHI